MLAVFKLVDVPTVLETLHAALTEERVEAANRSIQSADRSQVTTDHFAASVQRLSDSSSAGYDMEANEETQTGASPHASPVTPRPVW
jgi:hypothetical protein